MRSLSALCLLAAGTLVFAAAEEKQTPTAQATSLRVSRPLPAKKKDVFVYGSSGTTLEVTVSAPGKYIVGIDAKKCKLEHFTDDKKTKLFAGGGLFGGASWLNEYFVQITPDAERCSVQLTGQTAPAKGANKVLVKGSLIINCGSDEKTTDKKEIAMKLNTEASVGTYTLKVTQAASQFNGGQIAILSDARDVKSAEFLDAAGKTIQVLPPFRSSTFDSKSKRKESLSYFLPKKIDAVTVKVTYFNKVEAMTVPFDLSVGVGLD
jgi:hypothetical protein